ncbi:glycosyltransferase, partial [Patulibacter sp. S7RM1-6]
PNGAHAPAAADRAAARAELGLAPDDIAVVVSAMLRPEKGHDTALRALALLPERLRVRVRLLIMGGGPPRDPAGTGPEIARLAAELGVADRVDLLGRREDVPRVLAAADVGLLPSDHENLPLAMLEYMAAGLPVVATDVGGVTDAVASGVHGLLVPAGDAPAMAAALTRTLDDPAATAARVDAARARHREAFTWDAVAAAVEREYLRTLEGRR